MALTQKQLDERKYYIGSSEAEIISSGNLARWKELIETKHNATSLDFNRSTQLKMDAGSFMEPFVLEQYEEVSGSTVYNYQFGKTRVAEFDLGGPYKFQVPIHSTYDALTNSPASDVNIPVEAKCHWGMMKMDEICDMYAAQCQHHIYTADTGYCFLTVFFGLGARVEYRKILRDQSFIDAYLQNAKQWWNWYEYGIKPKGAEELDMPDWTDTYTMQLSELEQFDSQLAKEVDFNCQSVIAEKQAKNDADFAKLELRNLMPKKCRKMTHELGGNLKGNILTMTRTKGREPSIKISTKKEDK